jgi:tetratricopeptide (TPR) repeat protein
MTRESIVALAAALALAGCGSTERPPAVIDEARELARDGRDAFADGQTEEALRAFGEALERYRSIDDPAGIVRTLVNMAVVSQAAGRPGDAATCLDAIERYIASVEASTGVAPGDKALNEALAEASWMRAYLHADAGRTTAAWAEIERARARRGVSAGPAAGRFANLEARLHLDAGEPAAALAAARRALHLNRRRGDDSESADSWRFAGRALARTGDHAAAYDAFTSALDLDRDLGRPDKVVDDLLGMARAARDAGRPEQALACAERARTAARAAGDAKAEARARSIKNSL